MKTKLIILFILLVNTLFAQDFKGIVSDLETHSVLSDATITLEKDNSTYTTNELGIFIIHSITFPAKISITAIGYERIENILENAESQTFFLKSTHTIQLKEIAVNAGVSNQYKQISKMDIKMRGVNNSQEVLRFVPGLFIGQHQGGGKSEQIFIRGFDCDHGTDISLSVDGIPINLVSQAHGQGYADAHFFIPETIGTVDFKKGSYYAEKGNFDTAGYVDFKTQNTISQNIIKLEGGMFNTARLMGMFDVLSEKQKAKQQSWYVATENNYTDGYFENPQDFNRFNLYTKYNGKISNNTTLQLSASTLQSKWNASGQIPDRAVKQGLVDFYGALDPTEGGKTSRTNSNMQLLTTLKNNDLIKNQLYYSNYTFDLHTNFTFYLNDPINGDQIRQKENRNLFGYNGSYNHVSFFGKTKITTDAGINFRHDNVFNSELSNTINRYTIVNPIKIGDISETNIGIYASETLKFNEKWSANAGLRFDQFYNKYSNKLDSDSTLSGVGIYKAEANIFSPKLSFYYQANSKTQIYISSGRGFHSNDTRGVVVVNGREVLPPAYGVDLGTIFKLSNSLLLHLTTWYMSLKQEFVYSGDGGIVEITGATRRIGVDFSARYEPAKSLYLDIDATYAHGRLIDEPQGQDYIPLAPIWTTTAGITYKNKNGINGSLRSRFLADRPANEDYSLTAEGYFVTDAVLNYTKSRYEIGLRVNNLFNTKWKETQFATETRLQGEATSSTDVCFTPGTKFLALLGTSYFFN